MDNDEAEKIFQRLHRTALRWGWSQETSLELAQEAMKKILERGEVPEQLKRLLIDAIRTHTGARTAEKREFQLATRPGAADISVKVLPPTDPWRQLEARLDVDLLLAVLDPRSAKVLRDHFIEGVTQREIAEELGCDPSRVLQIIDKAVHKLRMTKLKAVRKRRK